MRLLLPGLVFCLPAFQDAGEAAIRRLVDGLGSPEVEVRERCETELVDRGPRVRKAVERLRESIDPEERVRANRILKYFDWGLTRSERGAVDDLLRKSHAFDLDDGTLERGYFPYVGDRLAEEWAPLGRKPVRYLLDLHAGSRREVQRRFLLKLAAISRDPAVLPTALEALKSRDARTRAYAASVCGTLGQDGAVPALAALLSDSECPDDRRSGGDPIGATVAHEAAEAIETIVGFPIDLKTWLDSKVPLLVDGWVHLDPKVVRAWWGRNEDLKTREEWRERARRHALELTDPASVPGTRLQGCLLLVELGAEEVRLCETILDLSRSVPDNARDGGLWRWSLALLTSPSPYLKGRPAPAMEKFLERVLGDERRSGDWTTALVVAWTLASDVNDSLGPRNGNLMPRLRAILGGFLKSVDPLQRYLASMSLAFLDEPHDPAAILETLGLTLEPDGFKKHPWLRPAAAWIQNGWYRFEPMAFAALARLKVPASAEVLKRYQTAEIPSLRMGACGALAAIGDESCLEALRKDLHARGDFSCDGICWRADDLKCAAFRSLYSLRRQEAVEWCRSELSSEREYGMFQADLVEFLLDRSEPAALEYWIPKHGMRVSWIRTLILDLKPGFLMPALLDLVEREAPNAREFLSWVTGDAELGMSPIAAIRSWWEVEKGTFKLDPKSLNTGP